MGRPHREKRPAPPTSGGKRVGGALYLHRDALPSSGPEADRVRAAERAVDGAEWNVAKIEKSSVSLLLYESFDVDFPALLASVKVDLASGSTTRTDYRGRTNPPVLHRKELLLPPHDPRLPRFRALTAAAEEFGLFRDSNKIGTRSAWQARIEEAGLVLRNGKLLPADEEHVDVVRHRTAIVRRHLSQPMQLMMRFGIVAPGRSVFDYGCGQGEDVEALLGQGFDAFGWDPHHAPGGLRKAADVVNLGFVINVIEDARERTETLRAAWSFAQKALCVAVMVHGKVSTAGHRLYRDGFVTSRGTFQKYFDQQELRTLVQAATGESPLALAPGIVAVFRDKNLEQEVLLRRRSRALVTGAVPRPPRRERVVTTRPDVRERLAPILDTLCAAAVSLGRVPEPEEAPREALAALARERVGWARAVEMLRENLAEDEAFALASEARRQDLLVHLALVQVPGAPKYKTLPGSIQADIKVFFGNHAAALEEARRLLFAAGDRAAVRTDVEVALKAGLGGMRGLHTFRFKAEVLPRLPGRLRVLVGCAEALQGGVDACDFVDLDLESPRVTMITCDDLEQPIPFIVERVRVDLGKLRVSADRHEPQSTPVYFKSRFLPQDDKLRAGQQEVEAALLSTGLFQPGVAEPAWDLVRPALKRALGRL